MNELAQETSPYLLQHANNPVHWKAWNPNSLSHAKTNHQLMIISIGYSACHWCHVMEHESFEDHEVAAIMNGSFTNIKVDREERPDIDAVYMKAIQIMSGRGGWPLNVVTLPDGRPIWGGTYFRKAEWINALEQLQELFLSQPEKLEEYAAKLTAGLQQISIIPNTSESIEFNQQTIQSLIEGWKKSFDWDFGGMARAPKFMMPNNYKFLMHYGDSYQDNELLQFVDLTLTKMAYGGIFDTVGGGFSRYAVDLKWHVPHFEKMLYDNAQLVSLYAHAFKRTHNPLYREVIEKTLQFVQDEWLTPEGYFYSALDADSLNFDGHLEEGAFYVWTKDELLSLLGTDYELFSTLFNINDFGAWENGTFVLIQSESIEQIAKQHQFDPIFLQNKKRDWEQLLFKARAVRSKPRLDDKCLTSWNALMLKGFVDAYKAVQTEEYLEIAKRNANFIVSQLWSADGNLWHAYKNQKTTINGFLEDYAAVIEAFIALYQVTFDAKWLQYSKNFTDYCLDHFYDENNSFFNFKSDLDQPLIVSNIEIEDNVIPASNSIMAKNLQHLSIYFDQPYYDDLAKKMIQKIVPTIDYPSAFSNWLDATLHYESKSPSLAICGHNALELAKAINLKYYPNLLVAATKTESQLPFLRGRYSNNQTLFYLCTHKACLPPTTSLDEILKEIES